MMGVAVASAEPSYLHFTPTPHHSGFYRLDALPDTKPTASKYWRQLILTCVIHRLHADQSTARYTSSPKDHWNWCRLMVSKADISQMTLDVNSAVGFAFCQASVTIPTSECHYLGWYLFTLLGEQRHMHMNNLPRVTAWQQNGQWLNLIAEEC